MIGTFGNIVFETTDKKILTFSNFSRQVSGRWNSTDTLRGKPVKEYLGDASGGITFDIQLSFALGISPEKMLNELESMATSGRAYPLIIGGKPIGSSGANSFLWILASISESWDTILNNGKIVQAKVSLTLEEYS